MEAVLKFNLPEEQSEYKVAVHAMDWALTAWDMSQQLREWLKYGHQFKTADEALEATQKVLFDIMDKWNINLDMID